MVVYNAGRQRNKVQHAGGIIMAKIYINLITGSNTAGAPWNVNAFGSGLIGVGTLTTDLTDSAAALTGIGLSVTSAFIAASGPLSSTGGDVGDWLEAVFNYGWEVGATDAAMQFTGLNNGDSYLVELAGHIPQADRDTNFTVDGVTKLYDCAGSGLAAAPVSFAGTVSGGVINISGAITNIKGAMNGITLEVTPAAALAITDIDTDNDVYHAQATTLTGTDLGANGGTLTIGGVSQTVASNTATSASITIVQDHLNYGLHDAIWTDTLANASPALPVTISPTATLQFVTAATPVLDDTSLFYRVTPVVVNGDQLEVPLLTDQGKSITIRANGTFLITGAASVQQTFNYRVHDLSLDLWTNYGAVLVN